MKLNITREQIIRAIVIITALAFILSTLGLWFKPAANSKGGSTPAGNGADAEQSLAVGKGRVELTIDSYSPIIVLGGIGNETELYLQQLQANGTALYVDKSRKSSITVALSKGEDTYATAVHISEIDPSASMLLQPIVYSDREFSFSTEAGVVSAKIPKSKITVSKPYRIGEAVKFDALVQFVDGKIVGAKLTPIAMQETIILPVLARELYNEYYVRMFFNWSDRVRVDESLQWFNDTLEESGAYDFKMNYIRDDTVYTSRSLKSSEIDDVREALPGLKTVQFNKIVFYSNYSYTENEVYDAVSRAANNTVEISFSPPMLEMLFKFDGNETLLQNVIDSYEQALPISKEIYRKGDVSLGDMDIVINNFSYPVNEMNRTAVWMPIGAKKNEPAEIKFDVSIIGGRIVDAQQNMKPKY